MNEKSVALTMGSTRADCADCYEKREAMPCFKDRRTFPHIDTVLSEASKKSVLLGEMFRFDRRTSTAAAFV